MEDRLRFKKSLKYAYKGKSCFQICRERGIKYGTFIHRMIAGWNIEDAISKVKTKKQIEWEIKNERLHRL